MPRQSVNAFIRAAQRGTSGGRFSEILPQDMGASLESGLWVYKYEHPNSDMIIGVPRGIPDETSTNVTSFELRNLFQVVAPVYSAGGTPLANTAKWGCVVLHTNFPEFPVATRVFVEGSSPNTSTHILGQYGDIRAAGWTFWAANGMVGEYAYNDGTNISEIHAPIAGSRYSKFRTMYKGVTIHQDANSLSDEGTVTVAQIGPNETEAIGEPFLYPHNSSLPYQFTTIPVQKLMDLDMIPALSERVLMNQGVSSINWPAKKGVYVVQKFNEPVNAIKFKDAALSYPDIAPGGSVGAGPVEGYILTSTWKGTGTSPADWPYAYTGALGAYDNGSIAGGSSSSGDVFIVSHQSSMQPAYSIFRGLNLQATLNIKTIEGIEAQINTTRFGDGSIHAHRSPPVDEYATKLATMVAAEVSGIYEACDNDFSDVIARISSVVRDVSGALGHLPGPWGIAANVIHAGASALSGALGK
jgi:hypothetical protein